MSAIIREIFWQEYDTTTQIRTVRADIICDAIADLPSGGIMTDYKLSIGSRAKVIADGSEWEIQSSGSWVRQPGRLQLDLTGYATTQDLSDGLAGKVDNTTYNAGQATQNDLINYAIDTGAKNLFNIDATPIVNHTNFTLVSGKLTVTANGNWAHYSVPINLPAGSYILSTVISGYSKASGAPDTSMRLRMSETTSGGTNIVLQTVTGNGAITVPFTWTGGTIYLQFYPNYNATTYTNSFIADDVMIRRSEITDSTYFPYAPTNRELYELIKSYHP